MQRTKTLTNVVTKLQAVSLSCECLHPFCVISIKERGNKIQRWILKPQHTAMPADGNIKKQPMHLREETERGKHSKRQKDAGISFFSLSPETETWPAVMYFMDAATDTSIAIPAKKLRSNTGEITYT